MVKEDNKAEMNPVHMHFTLLLGCAHTDVYATESLSKADSSKALDRSRSILSQRLGEMYTYMDRFKGDWSSR